MENIYQVDDINATHRNLTPNLVPDPSEWYYLKEIRESFEFWHIKKNTKWYLCFGKKKEEERNNISIILE